MMFEGNDEYAQDRLREQANQKLRDDVYKLFMVAVLAEAVAYGGTYLGYDFFLV